MTNQFGEQLRKLRQRSTDCTEGSQQALTQSAFVEQLYQIIGLIYTDSAVSNWERGINKISHENRALLIGIVKVLFKCGGLKRVEDANQLLASGGYSSLTNEEIEGINSAWLQGGRQAYLDTITPSMAAQLANLPILSGLVDMETTIVDVVRRLAERSASRHVVLTGRKGVGKSSVANAVVRRFVQTSTFTHLIWFSIEDKTDIAQSFIDFVGGKLKVNGTTPLAFKVQLYQLNVALQQHPCLIVIDGLQTLADLSDALAVINQLPPPTRVLFTSRLAPSVEALENIDVVPILELNAADAQTLLQMRNPALTADHCQAVYEQLGGHPETLQLLATYSRKWPIHRIL
ncbi:MAG: ATP-binding protein, partial [Chloroflexota bacterium]